MRNITITLITLFVTVNALAAIPVVKCSNFESKTFQLITKYEGWKPSVYTCPAGKQTIGWGFTSPEIISKGTPLRLQIESFSFWQSLSIIAKDFAPVWCGFRCRKFSVS